MKLVMMSDTHGDHERLAVPDGDALIHCGDFSMLAKIQDLILFAKWFGSQPHKYKLMVAGNHDAILDMDTALCKSILRQSGITYLENEEVSLGGLLFWGSPITPTYGDWFFMRDRGDEIEKVWKNIPEGIDVLITHGPPYGILDQCPWPRAEHVGCYDLLHHARRVKPKVHCFGHIHNDGGRMLEKDGTTFINCAMMDEQYDIVREPMVIEI